MLLGALHNQDDYDTQQEEIDQSELQIPYKYKQLEDDLIKYICQKIVAMREQPFIDAVDNLRRA
jgi:hypothetical protein